MFCRHVFGNISGGFRGGSHFSWDFAEIPEFRGSATARNIRSPEEGKLSAKIEDIRSPLAKILTDYSGIESANESHV